MSIESMIASSGEKVHIERATITHTSGGARQSTWSRIAQGVPAWVQDASASLIELYNRRKLSIRMRVYISEVTTILEGDRVEYNGCYYIVQGARNVARQGRLQVLDIG